MTAGTVPPSAGPNVFRRAYDQWDAFWFTPRPASVLVLFRAAIGVTAFCWLLSLLPDLRAFYGSQGLLPDPVYASNRIGLLRWWDSDAWLYVVYAAGVLAAALVTFGKSVRVSAPVLFVVILSLQYDNSYLLNSGDSLLRIWCFYLALFAVATPARFLGVPLFGKRGPDGASEYPLAPNWLIRIAQIQLTIVYPASVIAKFRGGSWVDGTASSYALGLTDFERFPVPGFVRESVLVSTLLTFSTLAVEFCLPFLLWTRRTRRAGIVLGLLLHAGLDYALRLGFFFWVMAIGYIAFLTPSEAARILGAGRALARRLRAAVPRRGPRVSEERSAEPARLPS